MQIKNFHTSHTFVVALTHDFVVDSKNQAFLVAKKTCNLRVWERLGLVPTDIEIAKHWEETRLDDTLDSW